MSGGEFESFLTQYFTIEFGESCEIWKKRFTTGSQVYMAYQFCNFVEKQFGEDGLKALVNYLDC